MRQTAESDFWEIWLKGTDSADRYTPFALLSFLFPASGASQMKTEASVATFGSWDAFGMEAPPLG